MNARKWCRLVLGLSFTALFAIALVNFLIDPCFHYRRPPEWLRCEINNERYQNDGILKHFSYEAMVTGTSMTENFKTSEVEAVFGLVTVKTPYSGGSYKEIENAVDTAIGHNEELQMVIRSLDISLLVADADLMRYEDYPEYLYDDNPLNDVNYLLNYEVLFTMTCPDILYTVSGHPSTSFDEYTNWNASYEFGREAVLASYERPEESDGEHSLSDEERQMVIENVRQNVAASIEENPKIEFYYFLTPYSIVYWDGVTRNGELEREIEAQRILIEELVQYENCHLFSWCDDAELVCDLDNYKDEAHYGEWVNSEMLEWMREGRGRLTRENYEAYLTRIRELYENYDYDSLFDKELS